ncbi:MAG: mannose-6-phosphate isomerase, class I, partial [Myxococcota bacterium]
MRRKPLPLLSPARLAPLVRHYAWGDPEFLPDLLGAPRDGRPWAEAWYGAHATGSALVEPSHKTLRDAIHRHPEAMLGPTVAARFGQLPYLLKIITPRRPLSIQVHPGPDDAKRGFTRENAQGLALDDPTRCYRDPNAKPELLYAITPFRALCGFRPKEAIRETLAALPEWTSVLQVNADVDLRTLLDRLVRCPAEAVARTWAPVLERFRAALSLATDDDDPRRWVLRAHEAYGPDSALLLLLLLAPRRLAPGECLFVSPGTVHAYLDGAAVEVMANSDNVVRAGLTGKHVDMAEFVRTARLAPAPKLAPCRSVPDDPYSEAIVPAPTDAFRLTRLLLGPKGHTRTAEGPETWLVPPNQGPVTLETITGRTVLAPGQAGFVPHGVSFRIIAENPGTQVLGASVPPADDDWSATGRILHNLATTDALVDHGAPASVVAFVSGNPSSVRTWAERMRTAPHRFGAREGLSLHEDRPVNQALGVLLAWQRLRDRVAPGEGCLAAFVFGEGTRATPITEAEGGDKPAIRTFVRDAASPDGFATTAEVALRTFLPVEAYLRRSGFKGFVVKWGDEIQIPSIDLSGTDPRLAGADVVRFVSMQPMTEQTAAHKDWIGMDADGAITGFLARRPLAEMRQRIGRGVIERDGELWGGINLGSIAMSRDLLDALIEELGEAMADLDADRRTRPDLDPQFFTALTLATEPDATKRRAATAAMENEVPAFAALRDHWPD